MTLSHEAIRKSSQFRAMSATVVWFLSFVLAFAQIGVHSAELVLCIEADGHITFESAVASYCGPGSGTHDHSPSQQAETNGGIDASHCDACIDIPIRTSSDNDCTSFRVEPAKYVDVELQPIAWLNVTPALKKIPFVILADAPSSGNGWQLTSLETVVLLT